MKIKNIKCKISVVIILMLLFVSIFIYAEIYAAGNGLAVSAGKDFGGGVNTIQDAKDASAAYKKAGLTTITFTKPEKNLFTSENLKANVLFLSGHANEDILSFGDDLIFACQSGETISSCINIWNTAKYQNIITFAGCNTAGGGSKNGDLNTSSDNITKRAVDQGADVAVGWTSTVSAGSHTNWLKRYNDALADGKSVSKAIDKANAYIYLPGSGVKNVKYYGDGDVTLSSAKSRSMDSAFDSPIYLSKSNYAILEEIRDLALLNQDRFNTEIFAGYISKTTDNILVDAYYKYNDIITNSVITIKMDTDGKIIGYKTYNINPINLEKNLLSTKQTTIKTATMSFKSSIAFEELNNLKSSEKMIKQEQFEYYDITSGKTYLVTYTEILDDMSAKYVKENITYIE